MNLAAPSADADARSASRHFRILVGLTLLAYASVIWIDNHCHNSAAPFGIISLQLTPSLAGAQAILAAWWQQPGQPLWVALGLGFDFLFILLYTVTMTSAVMGSLTPRRWHWGILAAGAPILAGLLDVLENVAHFQLLLNQPMAHWVSVGFGCAASKLLLLAGTFVFLLWAGIARRRRRPGPNLHVKAVALRETEERVTSQT